MKIRLLFVVGVLSLLLQGCLSFHGRLNSVRFRVVARNIPQGSRIFVAGEGDEFGNWKADGVPLELQPDGSWAKTIMLPAGKTVQFRITRGHWWTQALDERGPRLRAMEQLTVMHDTTVALEFSKWMDIDGGTTLITAKDVEASNGFALSHGWRYRKGDNPLWSAASFIDSSWEIVNSHLDADDMPTTGWSGIGWFRLHLEVDSSLWNRPLAINFVQAGASEIYLDGDLIYYVGDVGRYFSEKNKISIHRNPEVISFGPTRNHVIAVRYSSGLKALPSYAIDYGRFNGFDISIEDWNTALNAVHETVGQQMTFTTILGAFAFIHIILFIFYPKFRENLFYSLSTIGIGAVWFFNDLSLFLVSEKQLVLLNRIIQTSIYIAIVSGFYLVHYLTRLKFPKRWNAYVALGVLLAAWGIVYENQVYFRLTDAYIVVAMVEMTWMAFRAPRTDVVAGYILKVGFLVWRRSYLRHSRVIFEFSPHQCPARRVYLWGYCPWDCYVGFSFTSICTHKSRP